MLEYLEIEGYKSIKELKIELRPINILIGSNGAGKSNFISFFKLLRAIFNQRLQRFVLEEGKADNLLYFGRKTTKELYGSVYFRDDHDKVAGYGFRLVPSKEGRLFFSNEGIGKNLEPFKFGDGLTLVASYTEESEASRELYKSPEQVRQSIKNIIQYHFNDTTATSAIRKESEINDNRYLKHDGSNLAAMLYYLKVKHPIVFKRIEKTVRRVAPFFNEFILEPDRLNERLIELRWNETDDPDSNFGASQFSDGT
ncbi:MAG TPA: hypothetical protein DHN29_04385, partial [Cytophagales bacterium]|nr:hypothetical protein [Cytophagales bacterium]